ncbi:MAG: metallophosphoesterase [Deltaproteobacteria bacterium]|nr:metallophosphoesterase [Deltaproteobacteria bacterium]MBW2534151.1 metallophosphoesterase [Deltaproteobacteria bacterium]
MSTRSLLVFISDLHLTDALKGPRVARADTLKRFWTRIDGARGDRPAELVFVGDLFDIVRSPRWLATEHRPYHEPSPASIPVVDEIVAATLEREEPFFGMLRDLVQRDALRLTYILGNHDRLLRFAPKARRAIWKAMTGEDRKSVDFPRERTFPDHGVLAHHGHSGDFICYGRDGAAPIGDAIGVELIVRFPPLLRGRLDVDDPVELDDIDDVRPVYAVPAWVRQLGQQSKGLIRPLHRTWSELVDEFLANRFVRDWMKAQRKGKLLSFDAGRQLKLLLELSTGRIMGRAQDKRLTHAYRLFQHTFDGRFARRAAERLAQPGYERLQYVVNGHSHFPSMTPLGQINGKPAVYFNTGTWRTVHQIGTHMRGRPTFLAYDAMTYLVFFASDDPLQRDYEWWTGAMVAS